MKLLGWLQIQLEKQAVGSLVLGKKTSFREIFFEKESIYLCADTYSGRVDMPSIVASGLLGRTLTAGHLESILSSDDLKRVLFPEVLHQQGVLDDPATLSALMESHVREEVLDLLFQSGDSFTFREGRVPEVLLARETLAARTAIPLREVVTSLIDRLEARRRIERVLPSGEEVLVLTASGMKYQQQHPHNFAAQRLFGLIDGLRTVRTLIEDVRFFTDFTLELIVLCLDREYLKKTLIPEVRNVSTTVLSVTECGRLLPFFKNAVKHFVDPLAARERLAVIYEKLGQAGDSIAQYNFIGDALSRMEKPAQAIKAFRKALALRPSDTRIAEKITRIYYDAAEAAVLKGDHQQAAQLLDNALQISPGEWAVFEKLAGILARARDYKQLGELCDRIAAYAKDTGDRLAEFKALEIVIERVPGHMGFQRKLANAYLDSGETRAAARLLIEMVHHYLRKDQPDKALELLEKIQRIGHLTDDLAQLRRKLQRKLDVREPRKPSRVRRTGVPLLALLVVAYQAWSYYEWARIEEHRTALATESPLEMPAASDESGALEGIEPGEIREMLRASAEEVESRRLAESARGFMARFPASVFYFRARTAAEESEERARSLSARRERVKDDLLADADLYLAEGGRKEVEETLRPLLDLGTNHPWSLEARRVLEGLALGTKSSHELVLEARKLEEEGEPRKAYAIYRQVLELYPRSQFAKTMELPVLVESLPSGALVVDHENPSGEPRPLGTSPCVVHLSAGGAREIELVAPGHRPLRLTLYESDGEYNLFVLLREPLWSRSVEEALSAEPVVRGSDLVLAHRDGILQVLELSSNEIRAVTRRERLANVTMRPLATPGGVYTAWNDGTIAFLPLAQLSAGLGRTVEFSLPEHSMGLATTEVVALPSGPIAAGTSRARLLLLERATLRPLGEVELASEPRHLAPLGGGSLLVTTAAGEVLAIRAGDRSIEWKREFGAALAEPAVLLDASVVLQSSEHKLHFLDPATGEDRFAPAPLGKKARLELDAKGGFIYVLGSDQEIASISSRTGEVVAHRKLHLDPTGLQSAAGCVAILHNGGKGLLVLDGATLAPRWATDSDVPILRVSADAAHLVLETDNRNVLVFSNEDARTYRSE